MKRYLIILTFLSCFIIVDGQKNLGAVYFRNPRYLVSFDKIIYPGYKIAIENFTVREYLLDSLLSIKYLVNKVDSDDNYQFENWILFGKLSVNEKNEINDGIYSLKNELEGVSLNEYKTGTIAEIMKVSGTYLEERPFESNEMLMNYLSDNSYLPFYYDSDDNGYTSDGDYWRGSASETFKEWGARMLTEGDTSQNHPAIAFERLKSILADSNDRIDFEAHWEATNPFSRIIVLNPDYYLKQMRENLKTGKEILVDDLTLVKGLNTETNTETSSLIYGGEHSLSADEIVDYNGNVYKTVIIGGKKWMAENLRASNFNNGIPIPKLNEAQWNNTASSGIIEENINGNYYNFYTFLDDKNVCPVGYHTPNEYDINHLYESITPKGYFKNRSESLKSENDRNYQAVITFLFEESPEYSNPLGFSLNENLVSMPLNGRKDFGNIKNKLKGKSALRAITYIDDNGYPQVWYGNNSVEELEGIKSFGFKNINNQGNNIQQGNNVQSENSKKLSTHIRCVSDEQKKNKKNKKLKQ
jgi:uncharacterized protein (TIGR02145 family)